MQKYILAISLVLAVAVVFTSRYVLASDNDGVKGEVAQYVIQIGLASQLAIEGRQTESPLVLAAAAEILANININEEAQDKTQEGGDQSAIRPDGPVAGIQLDAIALYDEAFALANGQNNEALAGVIAAQKTNVGSRQSTHYVVSHNDSVRPRTRDVYTHSFNGGEEATVLVVANGEYDIDLQIYDMNNNLIAEDLDYTSVGLCKWIPKITQEYKIKVVNGTSNWVDYAIFSN
ncbi:MAG: hypothetical protein LBE38_04170 [Deltaproteobacteria bacterium]|jgi:hypothetical protein|nr:hypothetical protein [Deltaproteobacteria bacterium]